jgi:hypothetical protein
MPPPNRDNPLQGRKINAWADAKPAGEHVAAYISPGASCPLCGHPRTAVTTTRAAEGSTRVRYHRCKACSQSFKSIEEVGR